MGRKRSRRGLVVVLAVVLVGVVGIEARAKSPATVTAEPTVGPLIAGASSYVNGTFVWTDYAYDDRGPDTNTTAGGDATYPASMKPNNVADLVQLQLALPDDGHLGVTAVLETLTDATRPLIGVALDGDNQPATGAPSLPGSWTSAPRLGLDRLLLLGRSGGQDLRWDGSAWKPVGSFSVALNPADNTVRATVPFTSPASGTLRAVAALGYDDGSGGSWATGASPVHDLAFVTDDVPVVPFEQAVADAVAGFASGGERQWQEDHQSAILAGKGDATAAVASIDVAAMKARRTSLAGIDKKGFHTFLYRSELNLGEGVAGSGNSAVYQGPYQPYLVWVPGAQPGTADPYRGMPLVLYLHGSSQTHTSAVNTDPYQAGGPFSDFQAVVAWPLGRGPQTWYDGAALRDPLDVADDVLARLSLDRERVMLAGLSMGGYGTFKLGEMYPDRWSVAYIDASADDTGMPENLTALPVRFQNGVADPLIPLGEVFEGRPPPPFGTRALVDGTGSVDYRSYYVTNETHAPAVELAECIYRASFSRPRVQNPARVRYTVDPAKFIDDDASGLHVHPNAAYWVSGIEPATKDARGSVDATTLALGATPVVGATFSGAQQNVTEGRDFCGPNEAVSTGDTWTEQGRVVDSVARPAERRLTAKITKVRALTIAADRAGLGGRGQAQLTIASDTAGDLTLTGLSANSRLSANGQPTKVGRDGTVTVHLVAGSNAIAWG